MATTFRALYVISQEHEIRVTVETPPARTGGTPASTPESEALLALLDAAEQQLADMVELKHPGFDHDLLTMEMVAQPLAVVPDAR